MARYVGTVSSPRPAAEVFEHLADFTTIAGWDPGVASSTHTGGTKGEVGATFHVEQDTAGPNVGIDYRITEIEHPRRVKLEGKNAWLVSIDVIEVEPKGTGCEVTYDATIVLRGPLRLFDPVMSLGLKRIGAKAKQGLTEHLNP
jgi:carbon monoxide dehydrogenase subunit G